MLVFILSWGSLCGSAYILSYYQYLYFPVCTMLGIYDEIGRYPMDRRPRGLCLIVNIANFDKGHRHLKARTGAERDGGKGPGLRVIIVW